MFRTSFSVAGLLAASTLFVGCTQPRIIERDAATDADLHLDAFTPPVDADTPPVDAYLGPSDGGVMVPGDNAMTLRSRDPLGALTSVPVQFGRPFRRGEVPNFPEVLLDGVAVATQADVKQRFADGSVRFAIVSFVAPSISASGTHVSFRDQPTGNNTPPSTASLLDARYDFEATVTATSGGTTRITSARRMLMDGAFTTWTSGPIATTLILADHTPARAYDFGFDSYRPIRPIVHATFWPTLGIVRMRVLLENSNTTELEDVAYDVDVSLGDATPRSLFRRTDLHHYFGTRWSQVGWIGAAPSELVDIDHDIAYLGSTMFIPRFEPSHVVSEAEIALRDMQWRARSHTPYDEGLWTRYMPATGGRPDIAPIPPWCLEWLYTGDHRTRDVCLGQADLAAAWPLQFREGDASLHFDRAGSVSGVGLPISLNGHPSLWLPDNSGRHSIALPTPRIETAGVYPTVFGGWQFDGAHQPDPFSVPYMLTGDYFYLEQMQLWAAAQALAYPPGLYGRGVDGRGGIQDQIRGNGWVLRNRTAAALFSPDGTPERQYFTEITDDALALWEGQRNITGTARMSNPNWMWARTNRPIRPSVLGYWDEGSTSPEPAVVDPTQANTITSLWMNYYFLSCLGQARERGFDTGPLLTSLARVLNTQFGVEGYDPHFCAAYRTGVLRSDNTYFADWPAAAAAFTPEARVTILETFGVSNYYPQIATCAAAFTRYEAGGDTAWTWLDTNVRPATGFDGDLISWNVIPRDPTDTPLAP